MAGRAHTGQRQVRDAGPRCSGAGLARRCAALCGALGSAGGGGGQQRHGAAARGGGPGQSPEQQQQKAAAPGVQQRHGAAGGSSTEGAAAAGGGRGQQGALVRAPSSSSSSSRQEAGGSSLGQGKLRRQHSPALSCGPSPLLVPSLAGVGWGELLARAPGARLTACHRGGASGSHAPLPRPARPGPARLDRSGCGCGRGWAAA